MSKKGRPEKYGGERLAFVLKKLKKDGSLSITKATKMMCKKFDIEYKDSIRRCVSTMVRNSFGETEVKKGKIEDSKAFRSAQKMETDSSKETYIITWAQNNTPVHSNFFSNIESYAEALGANLHVIAGRYKNPTSIWTYKNKEEEFWSQDALPYLDANRHKIHPLLQVLSDVKISPTSSTPLTGMNGLTGLESCIIGHPRQHLKSLAVLEGYPHKLLLSTGACTVANYTDTKVGKKGEFHHMLGFIIIELDGKDFHIRQVNADRNGNFYDLFRRVYDGDVMENTDGAEAAILGDIHVRHNSKAVTKAAFELVDYMKPKHTIVHDIAEMESILHWDKFNPFKLLYKEQDGRDNLEKELDEIYDWVEKHLKYNLVISRSNHDDMLDRWLMSNDWRKGNNKAIYLELAGKLARAGEAGEAKGILPILLEERFGDKIKTLSLDDSFRVKGWELAMHGHLGSNGSRGGHIQFKNLNTKNITGHGHHPHREDGHIMVGTLSHLRVGFNRGASNWMNGICFIYADGKAQLIHIINGKYSR